VIVTAAHGFPFVPAFHVDPAEHDAHTPLLVFVAGVSPLPVVHEVIVTAEHGTFPEAEKVLPAAHATWHTVSAVSVQAVLTPAVHVEASAHAVQELVEEENFPATHVLVPLVPSYPAPEEPAESPE